MIDQKLVLEKCFCDLAFTDFQTRRQKSETILENKMFQKFKFKKKNVNNYFDIEIDFENQFLTTGLKVSGSWIKKHFSM